MRLLYFLAVFLFVSPFTFAQKQSLQQVLEKETAGFRGDVGIYVLHLKTGEEAAINADTIFPTASIVKVPILVGVMDKIEKGELAYHQKMVYRDSIKYGGSGLMQYFKDSTETELSVLMSLMITYSDNTTSLWCQSLAGGGERINEIMESLGLQLTHVNSRTPGREEDWKKYGWGQTTPREMAQLLVKIRKGEVISLAASDRMYRLMGNIYYDEYALSEIPAQVQTASKQGMVNASRSELVLVNAPKGDYVFYFATKNNEDQRWEDDNEAQLLQKRISKVLWEWFEK
ncbi:serine hydrolase [Cognataquiflexum rubidum]|uniref:serine hydrolase n=1 Tax=Cognataquiflexum rubidum TaxID=2922273 RepID=UPI001F1490A2|nr:serine hydrolase [Cognataquiflexum rubidum]MCH6233346.1 class A beta-lactamase-related serine hydrolase [Cognataquiflexum rubidum]